MKREIKDRYGSWAIVTGAARGLGKAYAEECAKNGMNLVLVDILREELENCASIISDRLSVTTRTVVIDLGEDDFLTPINQVTAGLEIGLLCCNHAGTLLYPDNRTSLWLETSINMHVNMLNINLRSFMVLAHHFGKSMVRRKSGAIIFISSGSGRYGIPYLATYSATKAAIINFGKTLHWELKEMNVDVLTVIPGMVDTPGIQNAAINISKLNKLPLMSANIVAHQTFCALGKQAVLIPGWKNKIQNKVLDCLVLLFGSSWITNFFAKFYVKFFKTSKVVN